MSATSESLPGLDDRELAALAGQAVAELTRRGTPDSFRLLVELSAVVGSSLGESARQVAANGSWSQVADITGTTKQAAWSRWR
ncbi:MAG TPA: hypothetical protein VFU98_19235 [Microlunatus sp.]|nr:hypothetical protein [Microlunatus sp.]